MKRLYIILSLFVVLVITSHLPAQAVEMGEFNEVTRLAVTARVWGFLKYYHPTVTTQLVNMDELLVNHLDSVRHAPTKEAFNTELQIMILNAGKLPLYGLPTDHTEVPLLNWFDSNPHLDAVTVHLLKMLKSWHLPGRNRYFSRNPEPNGHPTLFKGEISYPEMIYPSEPYRLIALFRFWNIIDYFFPYKDLMDEDWEGVLLEFIPRLIAAKDAQEYNLAMAETLAHIDDSHGGLNSDSYWDFFGRFLSPLDLTYIEGQTVVTTIDERVTRDADIRVGDVIETVDGVPVEEAREAFRKYIAASNEDGMQRNINYRLLLGHTDQVILTVSNTDGVRTVVIPRVDFEDYPPAPKPKQNQVWRILDGNIGYIDVGLLPYDDAEEAMEDLLATRALILDVRGYPNSTMEKISEYLLPESMKYARFSFVDEKHPGLFCEELSDQLVGPINQGNPDYYKGKVILLCNQLTQSQAEFFIMGLQVVPGAVTIGSTTAGADGNINKMRLPGDIEIAFTGLGVFYPDGTPTQRIGIKIDEFIKPTLQGIRDGRDEVLEKALEVIENQ